MPAGAPVGLSKRLHLLDHCIPPPPPAMKLLSLITAALLPLTALAAKKPTGDLFQKYNAKQLSASGSFKLDDKSYAQLTKAPRDYSVAVLLTALEARFGCGLCNDFQPEYDLLARSWSKGDKNGEGRLLFGTLDFLDGKSVFQSVCPTVLYCIDISVLTGSNSCNFKPRPSCSSSTRLLDPTRRPTRLLPGSTSFQGELSRLQGYNNVHTNTASTVPTRPNLSTHGLAAISPTLLTHQSVARSTM